MAEEDINDVSGQGSESADMGSDGDAPKSKINAKKIILIVVPLLILLGGAGAAYYMGYFGGKVDCSVVQETDENYAACAAELAAAQGMTPGVFIDIPDMIVNLNSASRQPRFLKIRLKVELEDAKDQAAFEVILPRVVDQFQTYLRELRIDDLRGSSGMYRMKIELLSRVKAAAPNIGVRDVLFQEILIQ